MNELAVRNQEMELTQDKIELIKRTIAKGASNDELELFIAQCNRTQLDPFARQIYCIPRWDNRVGKNVFQTQISIDGMRLVAQRSKEYAGQTPAYWCGKDGVWVDVWLDDKPPSAAKVGVYRVGFVEPLWAVANWDAYVQTYVKDGKTQVSPMWQKMGALMLSKTAEALALRKAFPMELSGLYTPEEMSQSEEVEIPKSVRKKPEPALKALTVTREPPKLEAAPEVVVPEIVEAEIVEPEPTIEPEPVAATEDIPEDAKPQPWWSGLHVKAAEAAEALELDEGPLCDAVVLKVTGRGVSTKDVKDRSEANKVAKELGRLLRKETYVATHFTDDGTEYYEIMEEV